MRTPIVHNFLADQGYDRNARIVRKSPVLVFPERLGPKPRPLGLHKLIYVVPGNRLERNPDIRYFFLACFEELNRGVNTPHALACGVLEMGNKIFSLYTFLWYLPPKKKLLLSCCLR
jgi:hypothetical protein